MSEWANHPTIVEDQKTIILPEQVQWVVDNKNGTSKIGIQTDPKMPIIVKTIPTQEAVELAKIVAQREPPAPIDIFRGKK